MRTFSPKQNNRLNQIEELFFQICLIPIGAKVKRKINQNLPIVQQAQERKIAFVFAALFSILRKVQKNGNTPDSMQQKLQESVGGVSVRGDAANRTGRYPVRSWSAVAI
jgi:hypothetical protein